MRTLSILDEQRYDGKLGLVNWHAIEGAAALNVGSVNERAASLGRGFHDGTTYVLVVAHHATRGTYDVVAFDDESRKEKRLYAGIPDLELAYTIARYAWAEIQQYTARWTRDLHTALDKYRAKKKANPRTKAARKKANPLPPRTILWHQFTPGPTALDTWIRDLSTRYPASAMLLAEVHPAMDHAQMQLDRGAVHAAGKSLVVVAMDLRCVPSLRKLTPRKYAAALSLADQMEQLGRKLIAG